MKICEYCGGEFKPKKSKQRFCCRDCVNKNMIGKPSKKKNGKIIKCKTCGKEFYISKSRFSFKKYCSSKCAHKDNLGFKPRTKTCVICGKPFTITTQLKKKKKTCSDKCNEALRRIISEKARIKDETIVTRRCRNCGEEYELTRRAARRNKYKLCKKCRYEKIGSERFGKNNPNFKGGLYIKRKRRTRQNVRHLHACQKYRKHFLEKHEYLFCEVCGKNQNEAMQFQVHHIYSASRFPKHKELHNFKNLILVCLKCHQEFHRHTYKKIFKELEESRGLKKLFGTEDREITC